MKTALVTGANKGLGLAWVKHLAQHGYNVILTSRKHANALDAANALKEEGLTVYPYELDTTDEKSIERCVEEVKAKFDTIDLLINNAGINSGTRAAGNQELLMKNLSLEHLDASEVLNMLHVNTVAPILVTRAFLPLLEKSEHPKVIHIGSWLGSVALKKSGGNYSYAVSKSALNMMNRALAYDIQPKNIISVVINPGWTQTSMGGSKAQFTTEESVENMHHVVDGLKLSDSGNFFNYNGELHPY